MSEATVAVARAWIEACNRGDVDVAIAIATEDVVLTEATTLPGAVTSTGAAEVRRYLERFSAHWSEAVWTPLEWEEIGEDRVLVVARLWLRGARSGIEVDRVWTYLFTVRDGRLARQDGFDTREQGLAAAG